MKKSIEIIVNETNLFDRKELNIAVLGSGSPISYFKHLPSGSIKHITFVDEFDFTRGVLDSLRPKDYYVNNTPYPDFKELEDKFDNDNLYLPYLYHEKLNSRFNILSEDDFNAKVQAKSQKIDSFIQNCITQEKKFDLLILSKILSSIKSESPKKSPLLNKVRTIMNEGAKIFLRVNGKNYQLGSYGAVPYHNYSKKNLESLISNFKILQGPETIIEDEAVREDPNELAENYWVVLE